MAVLSNTMWRANPGKFAEVLEAAGSAKKIHERLGSKCFLIQWSNAGSFTGLLGYGMIFDDMAAWGRFADHLGTDPEWQAWMTKYYLPANTPGTLVSQSTAADLPGFEAGEPAAPGTFVLAVNAKLAPGRSAAEALQLACEARPVVLEHGARWMRFRRVSAGGEGSLMFVATIGFASAEDFAKWEASYASDARTPILTERIFGTAAPYTDIVVAHGRVLPI